MSNSRYPIQLDHVLFTRSSVIAVPEHRPEPKRLEVGPTNTVNITKIDGEPGHYGVSMTVIMNPQGDKASPYMIDMEVHAEFTADDTLTEEEAKRGILINGHSVLYGAIREAVAWLTSRQPYGPLMLGLSVLPSKAPENKKIENA